MKQKVIKTDKSTLLVIEVSEVTRNVVLFTNEIGYYADGKNKYTKLPQGNWQLLGRLPDITENEWKVVVDDYDNGYFYYPDGYKDTCDTATESGLSLLQANEVYFDNPFGDEPKITSGEYDDNGFGDIDKYQFKRDLKSWQEAQSKVWDKERTYLFIKVD